MAGVRSSDIAPVACTAGAIGPAAAESPRMLEASRNDLSSLVPLLLRPMTRRTHDRKSRAGGAFLEPPARDLGVDTRHGAPGSQPE